MDCERATLVLPWLRNGSLDRAEHEAVATHLHECPACRAALVEIEEAWETFGAHLPPEALTATLEGVDWPGIPNVEIEAHLDICPSCQLELALLGEAASEDSGRLLSVRRPSVAAALRAAARPRTHPLRNSGVLLRLAAVLALVAGGWGLWSTNQTLQLGAELSRLGAPRIEPPTVELAPNPRSQRGGATQPWTSVALGEAGLRLVVSTDDMTEYAAYRLELADSAGRLVWVDDSVQLDARRELALVLSMDGTAPGTYQLRLIGQTDGARVAIDSYSFELTRPAPARSITTP